MYKVVLLFLIVFLQGCASNSFVQTKTYQNGISLKDQSIYVYSFLDIRDNQFGSNMLKMLDEYIISDFQSENADVKVVRFLDSKIAKLHSVTNDTELPIDGFILENLENEQNFSANYRLIIIPSKMRLQGAWKHYDITWQLQNVKTNMIAWKAISEGSHLTTFYPDENPDERAKKIIDSLFIQLKKDKLI